MSKYSYPKILYVQKRVSLNTVWWNICRLPKCVGPVKRPRFSFTNRITSSFCKMESELTKMLLYVRASLDEFGLTQPLTTNWNPDPLSFSNFLLSLQLLAWRISCSKQFKQEKIRKVKTEFQLRQRKQSRLWISPGFIQSYYLRPQRPSFDQTMSSCHNRTCRLRICDEKRNLKCNTSDL